MKVFNLILITLVASMPQSSPSNNYSPSATNEANASTESTHSHSTTTENNQSTTTSSNTSYQPNAGNYPTTKSKDDLLKVKLALDLLKLLNIDLGINLGNLGNLGNIGNQSN
ncbi:hypothetical protein CONCODRAFT_73405 [Conidiobolus coronatus NRRL 28638]|uniref:Uncharacterized protein n=1 Tax=Conidiobolus coronatus (strain ATCC 28846 / CBS 209.66 / NRRL 28638) TaxID=796925 RepID=A0A137NVI3_CONC2|nr:hypothetical protein CONCODRAFT_73405 [Conidiobolus coronatus NRRL 28638]|eukprot:KXN66830.1 hypothetical protein CONCODRAFT_73405 [Conidiobolus coronatus NRRL 28638]